MQDTQLPFAEGELSALVDRFYRSGATQAQIRGLDKKELEAVYSAGYRLYNQGRYADALDAFKFLCFYDHLDKRFWMGQAACHQLLGRHEDAVNAYSMAAMLDVRDPMPPLHAADCHIAARDLEKAESGLEAAIHWAGSEPKHAAAKARAEALLAGVRKRRQGGGA